jgi:hypothetical protein
MSNILHVPKWMKGVADGLVDVGCQAMGDTGKIHVPLLRSVSWLRRAFREMWKLTNEVPHGAASAHTSCCLTPCRTESMNRHCGCCGEVRCRAERGLKDLASILKHQV